MQQAYNQGLLNSTNQTGSRLVTVIKYTLQKV